MEWLALNRADNGALVKRDGDYFDAGCPIAGYLTEICDELIGLGLLASSRPSSGGHRRVRITDTGKVRYALLSDGQHTTGTDGSGR